LPNQRLTSVSVVQLVEGKAPSGLLSVDGRVTDANGATWADGEVELADAHALGFAHAGAVVLPRGAQSETFATGNFPAHFSCMFPKDFGPDSSSVSSAPGAFLSLALPGWRASHVRYEAAPDFSEYAAVAIDASGVSLARVLFRVSSSAPQSPPTIWWQTIPAQGLVAANEETILTFVAQDADSNLHRVDLWTSSGEKLSFTVTGGEARGSYSLRVNAGEQRAVFVQAFDDAGLSSGVIHMSLAGVVTANAAPALIEIVGDEDPGEEHTVLLHFPPPVEPGTRYELTMDGTPIANGNLERSDRRARLSLRYQRLVDHVLELRVSNKAGTRTVRRVIPANAGH